MQYVVLTDEINLLTPLKNVPNIMYIYVVYLDFI